MKIMHAPPAGTTDYSLFEDVSCAEASAVAATEPSQAGSVTLEELEELEELADDTADESLFANVIVSGGEIPPMPFELVPFDKPIKNAQARAEAIRTFRYWLAARLKADWDPMRNDDSVACMDLNVSELFFPETPDSDDFDGGHESTEYRRAVAQAAIDAARAKLLCSECPFRAACLAKAVVFEGLDKASPDLVPENDHVVITSYGGIYGGWGPGARTAIANHVFRFRGRYLASKKAGEDVGGIEAWALTARTDPSAELQAAERELLTA